ncbi:MAG: TRAP transporter small permease [Akkermansiaceae bacterium]|nr:TRAP transporter small permease [Akkermansiaceae bacterium]
MNLLKNILSRTLNFLCASTLVALIVIVLLGIISKKMDLGLSWTDESSEFLLSWVVMVGAALAYLDNAHLGVDILTSKFTPLAQRISAGFVAVVVLLFSAGVMTYGGWNLFIDRYDSGQLLSSLPIRRAWFYFSIPLSGFLISLFALDNLRQLIVGKTNTNNSEEKANA